MRILLPLFALLFVASCADVRLPWAREAAIDVTVDPDTDIARPEARPGEAAGAPLGATGRTAAAFDRASPTERAAAQEGARQAGALLGETLASLGAPGESGFWLITGLVQEVTPGRVEAAGGQTVGVELRPSGREAGAGSQISLSAMRALDLPLTSLAPLRVFAAR